ncbi:hypothetical protein V1264_002007 [Littorina saxatilis]|uniref:Uncharacterized protein n=1 Tax=Littorina saxatilis TaxID=31220 RepID=A0AAN9C2N6_9CAEN
MRTGNNFCLVRLPTLVNFDQLLNFQEQKLHVTKEYPTQLTDHKNGTLKRARQLCFYLSLFCGGVRDWTKFLLM